MKLSYILLFMLISFAIKSQSITIELKIDSVGYYNCDFGSKLLSEKEKYIFGTVSLKNNSNELIVLPRSFDLFPEILDTVGNQINWELSTVDIHGDFTFRFNQSRFKRKPRLEPGKIIEAQFVEVRLIQFDMELGEEYYFKYYLPTIHYKEFRKQFGNKIFMSNAIRFRY
jgi:hypothetical protein